MALVEEKNIKFRVQRYISEKSSEPFYSEYDVPVKKGMTVLDALLWIKENLDGSLSMRYSCRMGVCGSCGMFINGLPRLACQTQVLYLESDEVEVRSLPNYPILRDLIPDLARLIENHQKIKPYIIRHDTMPDVKPERELKQTPEEIELYLQFSYCIKCGLCVSACPTAATDREFLGPQALAQAYRYSADTRDEGLKERMDAVDLTHGLFNCHLGSACSEACPKGVDPALGIQLLKREVVLHSWGFKSFRKGAEEMPLLEYKPKPDVPRAPERTVK